MEPRQTDTRCVNLAHHGETAAKRSPQMGRKRGESGAEVRLARGLHPRWAAPEPRLGEAKRRQNKMTIFEKISEFHYGSTRWSRDVEAAIREVIFPTVGDFEDCVVFPEGTRQFEEIYASFRGFFEEAMSPRTQRRIRRSYEESGFDPNILGSVAGEYYRHLIEEEMAYEMWLAGEEA